MLPHGTTFNMGVRVHCTGAGVAALASATWHCHDDVLLSGGISHGFDG